jgi:Uma2 family endonuclease
MSPLPEHEAISRIIGSLVVELALATNSPMLMLGSTTFRRRLKKKGLEPDECFYFANEGKVRGKKRLNLPKDPPPDLAVEIDITSRSIERLPIYAALGVPEVWRYDGRRLRCLVLVEGEYRPADYSLTFTFLRPADLKSYIERAGRDGHTATILAFREWVRKNGWV